MFAPDMGKENGSPSASEYKRPIFQTTEVTPINLSPDEAANLYLEALERLQKIAEGFAAKEEVVKGINVDHPIKVYVIGDLHLGHISSDGREIVALKNHILEDPFAGIIFVGDEIEGWTTKYPSTSTSGTHADAQQQIEMIKTLLFRDLAKEGRVLAMVGDYFGHPGWINDASTIDPWRLMSQIPEVERVEEQLKMYNAYQIQIITNGGLLHLDFPNGHRQTIRVFHYPEGKSKYDSLHGLREKATAESVDIRPDGLIQGHLHRAAIAKEQYAGTDVPVYFISSGTVKGSSPDKPRDAYGKRLGRPFAADPIGQGVIVLPRHRGDRFNRNYPFISFEQGNTVGAALYLFNATESQQTSKELLEQIHAKDTPKIQLIDRQSRLARKNSPYGEQQKREKSNGNGKGKDPDDEPPDRYPTKLTPIHDSLTYNIDTDLPIVLQLIANARIGSTVEGYADVKEFQNKYILSNPHTLVVYLRNMIDHSLDKTEANEAVNRLVKLVNPVKQQTIALLLDQNLRRSKSEYPPGTYISEQTGVPLIHHLSLIKIAVGPATTTLAEKPMYVGAFADKLERSGSYFKPTFGLRRLYDQLPLKPGYIAGGHLPSAGTMTFYHLGNSETNYPVLIAPGWWSKYVNTTGTGNVREGAIPGQAIIFMPGTSKNDYMVFPTVNADETRYLHDALILLKGLKLLGLDPRSILPNK